MTKLILMFGLISMITWSPMHAQTTDSETEIQVNLDDFDTQNMSQSERLLLNILIEKQVEKLEKQLEQLHADKKYGRITEKEYQLKKEQASQAISEKIGRSIDILTQYEMEESEIIFEDKIDNENIGFEYKKKKDSSRVISFSFDNECDTTIKEEKKQIITRFSGGLGFTNWLNSDNKRYDNPNSKLNGGNSLYYYVTFKNIHYLNKKGKYKKASIDYGLTFIERFYKFNNTSFSINESDNGINNIPDAKITKSGFSQAAFEIPLMLTYRFGKKNNQSFIISAGMYGGMNIRTRQKIEYNINGEEYKAKWVSSFNTNKFYAGAKAKIGYRGIFLNGSYNFTELFKSSSPIEVNPYTIGITFGL